VRAIAGIILSLTRFIHKLKSPDNYNITTWWDWNPFDLTYAKRILETCAEFWSML